MNKTILSIIDTKTNKSIFNTDSAPVIPNIGEVISVSINGSNEKYTVENRKIIYEIEINDRTTFVFVYVKSIYD